jgi:hypothetical protein
MPLIANDFCIVAWCIDDIKAKRPEWTEAQCAEFLTENEDEIELAMIDAGHLCIDRILAYNPPEE